ncbi:hypothetical protein ANO11243_091240 [Dothideomycetidae sp. 11243]|nr:hypothetical protein ANO11243_091240 [fungal sp. No.11243]
MVSKNAYKALAEDDNDNFTSNAGPIIHKESAFTILTLVSLGLLAASVLVNVIQFYNSYEHSQGLMNSFPSKVAHLSYNVTTEFLPYTDHESPNRTLQDAAWSEDGLDWATQLVALDQGLVSALNLPSAATWPWDASKSMYVLNSAHDLHCLATIRNTINAYHDSVPEAQHERSYDHVIHCLNTLRMSIMCTADDTPLYVKPFNAAASARESAPGTGSTRICRDWTAMTAWSRAHSGCFKPIYHLNSSDQYAEQFKFCPDGSKPWLQGS